MSKLSITTEKAQEMIRSDEVHTINFDDVAPGPALPLMRPGEVLLEEFMRPLGLSARALAKQMGIPDNCISGIVNGSRKITARTALLLARQFGVSARFWMNLQASYDLEIAHAEMDEDIPERSAAAGRDGSRQPARAGGQGPGGHI
jgi:addiction module HigA family antidote